MTHGKGFRVFDFSYGTGSVTTRWPATAVASLLLLAQAAGLAASDAEEPPIAAKVAGEPVYVPEVDDLIARTRAGRRDQTDVSPELRAEALEQAIHRRLVAQRLAQEGYAVRDENTDGLLDDLKRRLAAQDLSLDDFMKRHAFTTGILRRQLAWDVMWGRYLASELTDEALEDYFAAHRRDYDGTELRVSHVLFRVEDPADKDQVDDVQRQARQVREQIAAGKLSFADAAAKFSSGPSRRKGGDLGFIPRHDRMTEAFSRAAFELDVDQVSPPVTDQFGVHLICCTGVKPGEKSWQDVRRALAEAWANARFLELAEEQRKQSRVEYTGVAPHFDPKSHALVPANEP